MIDRPWPLKNFLFVSEFVHSTGFPVSRRKKINKNAIFQRNLPKSVSWGICAHFCASSLEHMEQVRTLNTKRPLGKQDIVARVNSTTFFSSLHFSFFQPCTWNTRGLSSPLVFLSSVWKSHFWTRLEFGRNMQSFLLWYDMPCREDFFFFHILSQACVPFPKMILQIAKKCISYSL